MSGKSEIATAALHSLSGGPAVMIGDHAQDVEGAIANGIQCLGAGWGFAESDELTNAGAAVVLDHARTVLFVLLAGHSGRCADDRGRATTRRGPDLLIPQQGDTVQKIIADLVVKSRKDRDVQLDRAVAAAREDTHDLLCGILVTRHDYARFTVSLTPAVPYGQIQELDQVI